MSPYPFDMSLNKYGFSIANMTHTAMIINKHVDPTFLISTNMQPPAT